MTPPLPPVQSAAPTPHEDRQKNPSFPSVQLPAVPSGPQRFRWVAELGIQAAEALQYAHDRGIIHRDIKPANLLLDSTGKLWITDFGLAHIEGAENLTMSGDLLGTLRYMSPEQALGSPIDHRTDIYSLGATLYELLTASPVITGNDRSHLLRQITNNEPRPLRAIDSQIPLDLQTIILKALSKEPTDRYASARALTADLTRFSSGKPILARPLTALQKLVHWSRRHTSLMLATAASLAGALIVVSIAAGFVLRAEGRATTALSQASTNLSLAAEREREMRLALYVADIPAAQRAWQTGDLELMRTLLERHIPVAVDQADHRGFEWHYFWQLYDRQPIIVQAHDRAIRALAISRDGRRLATGDEDGHVKVWRIPAFAPLGRLTKHGDGIRGLYFGVFRRIRG